MVTIPRVAYYYGIRKPGPVTFIVLLGAIAALLYHYETMDARIIVGDIRSRGDSPAVYLNGEGLAGEARLRAGDEVVVDGGLASLCSHGGGSVRVFPHPATTRGVFHVEAREGEREEGHLVHYGGRPFGTLDAGGLTFIIPLDWPKVDPFQIVTRRATLLIQRATGRVLVQADRDEVALKEGTIVVTSRATGESVTLEGGRRLDVDDEGALSSLSPYNSRLFVEKQYYRY